MFNALKVLKVTYLHIAYVTHTLCIYTTHTHKWIFALTVKLSLTPRRTSSAAITAGLPAASGAKAARTTYNSTVC